MSAAVREFARRNAKAKIVGVELAVECLPCGVSRSTEQKSNCEAEKCRQAAAASSKCVLKKSHK